MREFFEFDFFDHFRDLDVKGDWIDGLLVGFDMIYTKVGEKKYTKRIFLITDGENEVNESDQLEPIIDQFLRSETSLNVIALDFANQDQDSDSDDQNESDKPDGEGEGDDDQGPDNGKLTNS